MRLGDTRSVDGFACDGNRNESGLPVMAMDDVDRKTQALDGFDDRSRKETLASAVITEGTVGVPVESMTIIEHRLVN